MGARGPRHPALAPRIVLLLGCALLVPGCVPHAQAFEDWNTAWTAELSDRTGAVAAIDVLDAASPGAALAADIVRLQNLDPSTVEVAWLGGTCSDCAHFSLSSDARVGIELRYDIGAACDQPAPGGYALRIRVAHPVDAAAITPIPDWGP